MCEEKEGVMRNAMTTRAPGGAKNAVVNLDLGLTTMMWRECFRSSQVDCCEFLSTTFQRGEFWLVALAAPTPLWGGCRGQPRDAGWQL